MKTRGQLSWDTCGIVFEAQGSDNARTFEDNLDVLGWWPGLVEGREKEIARWDEEQKGLRWEGVLKGLSKSRFSLCTKKDQGGGC